MKWRPDSASCIWEVILESSVTVWNETMKANKEDWSNGSLTPSLRTRSICGEPGPAMSPHRSRIFIQHKIKRGHDRMCHRGRWQPQWPVTRTTARLGLGPHCWCTLPCLWLRGAEDAKGNIHLEMRDCSSVNFLTVLLTHKGKPQTAATQSTKPHFLLTFPTPTLSPFGTIPLRLYLIPS